MSDDRPNILPKGIVVNAPNIEQSIERLAGEPVDTADIERMWKVYTTTQRRLLDPTAIRLEHFWWRIWGSQRRELSASTIAALYAHISHGETVVPLRGPSNRDESGSPQVNPTNAHTGPSIVRPAMLQADSRPSTTSSVSTSKIPAVSPLPPILKKPDAPPPTGPRPSVGFASPADSDTEEDDEVEEASSISTNSQIMGEAASNDSQISKVDKKGKRKSQPFVVSKGGKKRPVLVRRSSSKSSAELKSGLPLDHLSPSPPGTLQPSLETQAPSKGKGKGKEKAVTVSKFQENFSSSPEKVSTKSKSSTSASKGRSKSKDHSESSTRENGGVDPSTLLIIANMGSNGDPGPSTLQNIQNMQPATVEEDLAIEELEEFEMQKTLLEHFERQQRDNEEAFSRGETRPEEDDDDDDLDVPSFQLPQRPRQSLPSERFYTPKPRNHSDGSLPVDTPDLTRDAEKENRPKGKVPRRNQQPEGSSSDSRPPSTTSEVKHATKAPTPRSSNQGKSPSQNFALAPQLNTSSADAGRSSSSTGAIQITQSMGRGKVKVKIEDAGDMFAKRPIPALSTGMSALSASVGAGLPGGSGGASAGGGGGMAKSRSQLSLLLERDRLGRGKEGGGKEKKDKEKDGGKKRSKKE